MELAIQMVPLQLMAIPTTVLLAYYISNIAAVADLVLTSSAITDPNSSTAARPTIIVAKHVRRVPTLNGRAPWVPVPVNHLKPLSLLNRPAVNLTIHRQWFAKRRDVRTLLTRGMTTVPSPIKSKRVFFTTLTQDV